MSSWPDHLQLTADRVDRRELLRAMLGRPLVTLERFADALTAEAGLVTCEVVPWMTVQRNL